MLDAKEVIRKRLQPLKLSPAREIEILEELLQHAEDRYEELLLAGVDEPAAAKAATDEVCESGLLTKGLQQSERTTPPEHLVLGESGKNNLVIDLCADLRYGFRTMRRNPIFSFVAIMAIAIGIGTNVLIITLVERILLSPLPYPESERLVRLVQSYPQIGLETWGLSPANFVKYRDGSRSFETLAAYTNVGATLTGTDKPEYLQAGRVTADFFKVFKVNPMLGRAFTFGEDVKGKNNVVVLSHGLWQRRFGSDPQIIGKWLVISDEPTQVIGVMPEGFNFPSPTTEMWLPMALNPEAMHPFTMAAVARLRPELALSAATADTTAIFRHAAAENPEIVSRKTALPPGADLKTVISPLKEIVVGNIERPLLILQIAVAFVLLIACANVANLLLSRAAQRTHEVALRLALGALAGRIIRQLITESLLLAMLGAVIGIGIAWWCLRLITVAYSQGIPRIQEATLGGKVLMVTIALTLVTGLLFGLMPALRTYSLGLKGATNEAHRSIAGVPNRGLNSSLVIVQLALSLVLLVGAGLMLKSLQRLLAVRPGFDTENVLTMALNVSPNKGNNDQAINFYKKLLDEVRSLPGVAGAAVSSNIPFSGRPALDGHVVEGQEPPGDEAPQAEIKVVSPGYFQAMGISLQQGRDFQDSDAAESPLVAIIDQTIAAQYFPNGDAIGKRIRTLDPEWYTIVGIVPTVKDQSLSESESFHLYLNYQQAGFAYGAGRDQRRMYLVVHTESTSITPSIRDKIRLLDPDVPIHAVSTMSNVINKRLDSQRLINLLLTIFSGIALLLAAIGTYGVMAVFVSSRSAEFAIRGALGASPRHLLLGVLKQGFGLAAVGCTLGLLGSWALTRAISSQLFAVSTTDPVIFGFTTALLILVTLLASYLPARRAAKTDPAVVLRNS